MTRIKHHPSDDVLLKYVTGQYDTAYSLVLATHLSQCVCCQNSVALHQEVAGATLRECEPVAMQGSALDLLDRQDDVAVEPELAYPPKKVAKDPTVPSILSAYLGETLEKLNWQRLTKDLKQYVIETEGKAKARLLWMAPGKAVPPHGHRGEEMTMILSGGYYDGDEAYTAGDLHIADHHNSHVPTAMEDKPCIVLAATDEPLIFSGLLPKLFQPFYKI